jgi:hypothetical protein
VAANAQGLVVTWGTATLGELVSVTVDGLAADTVEVTPRSQSSRFKAFRPADVDRGTVSLTLRGTAAMSAANVGLTANLSITGASVSWSFPAAVFETLGWAAQVGELQVYNVKFKV